jgi:hypothetical protein
MTDRNESQRPQDRPADSARVMAVPERSRGGTQIVLFGVPGCHDRTGAGGRRALLGDMAARWGVGMGAAHDASLRAQPNRLLSPTSAKMTKAPTWLRVASVHIHPSIRSRIRIRSRQHRTVRFGGERQCPGTSSPSAAAATPAPRIGCLFVWGDGSCCLSLTSMHGSLSLVGRRLHVLFEKWMPENVVGCHPT